jgi:hypothetical protein
MSWSERWQWLFLFLSMVIALAVFIWFLRWRQGEIALRFASTPPPGEKKSLSPADLDRVELQPQDLPETLDSKRDTSLYTALKTVRGEIIALEGKTTLQVRPMKSEIFGHEPASIRIDQLETIVCWPQYQLAADGSKIDLSEAYITIHQETGQFFWSRQKVWPFAKGKEQLRPKQHVLIKLEQDVTQPELVAEQLVVVGCRW